MNKRFLKNISSLLIGSVFFVAHANANLIIDDEVVVKSTPVKQEKTQPKPTKTEQSAQSKKEAVSESIKPAENTSTQPVEKKEKNTKQAKKKGIQKDDKGLKIVDTSKIQPSLSSKAQKAVDIFFAPSLEDKLAKEKRIKAEAEKLAKEAKEEEKRLAKEAEKAKKEQDAKKDVAKNNEQEKVKAPSDIMQKERITKSGVASRIATAEDVEGLNKGYVFGNNNEKLVSKAQKTAIAINKKEKATSNQTKQGNAKPTPEKVEKTIVKAPNNQAKQAIVNKQEVKVEKQPATTTKVETKQDLNEDDILKELREFKLDPLSIKNK